jgi:DNA replication licensing factor MCM4
MFLDLAAQPTSVLQCIAIAGVADVQAVDDEEVFLNIDLMHMYEYDRELYGQLISYPGEVIPLLDNEARYIAADLLGEELPEDNMLTVSENLSGKQGMLLVIRQAAGVPYWHGLYMQSHKMVRVVCTQVRPFNLKEHKVIRDLNPEDMNKLISVSGMVTRSSSIIPDPR